MSQLQKNDLKNPGQRKFKQVVYTIPDKWVWFRQAFFHFIMFSTVSTVEI